MEYPVPFQLPGCRQYFPCLSLTCACRFFSLLSCLSLLCVTHLLAEPEDTRSSLLSRLSSYRMTKSKTGRFTAMGPRALINAEACTRSERIANMIEQELGVKCPLSRQNPLRIFVKAEEVDPADGNGAVSFSAARRSLVIRDVSLIGAPGGDEAICRSLFALSVEESARQRRATLVHNKVRFPRWLSLGFVRYLNPRQRAIDSHTVLCEWQKGRLGLFNNILSAADAEGDSLTAAAWGTVVSWIVSMDNSREIMDSAFNCLAAGVQLDAEWLSSHVHNCSTLTDLESKWDEWILKQKRMIHFPGLEVTLDDDRLDAALLLYPGLFDIPLNSHPYGVIKWKTLIERRDEPWVEGFCKKKANDLRILTVGRSEKARKTAESYCRFLSALQRGARDRKVAELLEEAEALRREIRINE